MKTTVSVALAFVASAALLPAMSLAQTANPAGNCNRDCMEMYAVAVGKALLKHDASSLPVTKDVKVTENGKPSSLSSGIFKTASRFLSSTSSTQFVSDFTTGQVGMLAVIEDNQNGKLVPAMYALRVKIEAGKISEIEQIVKHESDVGGPFQPEGFIWREAPYIRTIPPKLYTDRKGLARTADIYWNVATTTHNGYTVPYTVDCFHVENGMLGSFERPLDTYEAYYPENNPQSDFDGRIWTCEREHSLSTAAWTKYKTHRRLIDEERGLVMDWNLVERTTGSFKINTDMPDGSKFEGPRYAPTGRDPDGWASSPAGSVPGDRTAQGGPGGPPGGGMGAGGPGGGPGGPGGPGGAPGAGAPGNPAITMGADGMGAAMTSMAPAGVSANYHAQVFRIVNGKIAREQNIWLSVPSGSASPF
jgi:hypothetical protein